MKITTEEPKVEFNYGDVICGKSKKHIMLVKDSEGYARILHLSSFTLYSVKYDSPQVAVKRYFDEGYSTHHPREYNELILGGTK